MALSGSVNTSAYGYRYLTVSWTATQNIANNTSTISWTLKAAKNGGSDDRYYQAGGFKVVIDGTTVYSKSTDYRVTTYNGTKIASGTHTISHAANGSKSFKIYVEAGIYYYAVNCTGEKTFTLDSIPREATITTAPNFNDEGNPTITYSNPAGNTVSSLQACIASTDGNTIYVPYRDISKTGTSYTFSLTSSERTTLQNACKTANSMSVKFYIKTVIGGNTFHSTSTKTLTITNGSATLSPSASVNTTADTKTVGLTGSNTTFIKGFTTVSVSTGAAARKGATITSQKITSGSKSVNAGSGSMSAVDSGTFTFTATDSRGNTLTQTLTRTLVNYIKLTCNMNPVIAIDGTATLNISGNVFNDTFGAERNTLTVQYRYKELGGSWSSWLGAGTGTKNGHTYSAPTTITGLSYKKRYVFQAKAYDKLMEITTAEMVASTPPVFDWGENDFNFNVDVKINNEPIADFVVEQGTSGNWSYRKWNSGIAECWARIAVNTAVNTAWGNLYVSGSLSATNLAFPFTFKAIPMINVNLSGSGSGAFLIASGSSSSSTTNTGGYEIARGSASSTATNYGVNYDVKGRWK